jgi:cyclopropane fatty-acyl-phospholipid synthase-like methyltransferase
MNFLGVHWHTGFYRNQDADTSPADQVRMIDHVAGSIGLGRNERVLDVGCGVGGTLCHLNKHYACEAVGLTPVPEQKKMAERLARSQNAVIRVDLGHADDMPYPSGSFDVVTFFESTCHFEDREAFFNEVFRVLKPGGRLAGEEWLARDLSNDDQRIRWINPICKSWAIPMLGDFREYRRLMESAGLIDVQVTDLQDVMALHKGFTVSESALAALEENIRACPDALRRLILRGLASLGMAVNAGAFTIGHVMAKKPGLGSRSGPERS